MKQHIIILSVSPLEWSIIIAAALLVIALITILIVRLNRKKKAKTVFDYTSQMDDLLFALGGVENIIVAKLEGNTRLSVELKNTNKISVEGLKEMEMPATIVGKTIKLLIKSNALSFESFLNSLQEE